MSHITKSITSSQNYTLSVDVLPAQQTPRGVIVYYHGGGLVFGQPRDLPEPYIACLNETYHIVFAPYRLAPEAHIDTIVQDAQNVFEAVQTWYPDLPHFTMGRSSGAFLSILMAQRYPVHGVVSLYGYSRIHIPAFLTPSPYYAPMADKISQQMIDMMVQREPITAGPLQMRYPLYIYARGRAVWQSYIGLDSMADPKYNLTPEQLSHFPPMFLAHCIGDPDVPFSETEHMAQYVPNTTCHRIDSDAHDFDRTVDDESLAIYQAITTFLNTQTNSMR